MEKKYSTTIHVVKDGYIQDPQFPEYRKKIPFGGIVCRLLNERYGVSEAHKLLHENTTAAILHCLRSEVKRGSIENKLDPVLSILPLISENRDEFAKNFSPSAVSSVLSGMPTVQFGWDGNQITATFQIDKLYDLIYFDIGKTLELQISIVKCKHCGKYFVPIHGNVRYCIECRDEGIAITRKENFKNNRIAQERKRIYDMLYRRIGQCRKQALIVAAERDSEQFKLDDKQKRNQYKRGEITEEEYYAWLSDRRTKYRKHP